ncbi:unnamed protein product [Clavelina lepadiformis]|uniref:Uncharacterized protein n=1 Tax=Clavelina lepadiformis TaxID=159417 RepID=A0ABP0H1Z0_CLALP
MDMAVFNPRYNLPDGSAIDMSTIANWQRQAVHMNILSANAGDISTPQNALEVNNNNIFTGATQHSSSITQATHGYRIGMNY